MSSSKNNTTYKKTSFLIGNNSAFINEFYADYLSDPKSIPESWRKFFEGLSDEQKLIYSDLQGPSWSPERKNKKINFSKKDLEKKERASEVDLEATNESVKAIALIRAYRIRGHLIANLDPLGMMERQYLEDLNPGDHGFTKKDYSKRIYVGEYMQGGYSTINDILTFFRKIYCSTIGVEYMHISDPVEKKWFRERMEKEENQLKFTNNGKKAILNKLIQAEGFENFLAVKFVGTKRFGLDGGESLIPALEQIIKRGGHLGFKEVKIGQPHRGRH